MAEASDSLDARSRKVQTTILQAMQSRVQADMAKEMEISESTVSRWKTEEVPVVSRFLTVIGLSVYPNHFVTVDPEYLQSLRVLARVGLEAK